MIENKDIYPQLKYACCELMSSVYVLHLKLTYDVTRFYGVYKCQSHGQFVAAFLFLQFLDNFLIPNRDILSCIRIKITVVFE